jgi:periplasmic divalent cation tolerance protein
MGPVESEFWWQGKIDKAQEFLVLMKLHQKLFEKLSKIIEKMHSYGTPEILALSIVDGLPPYLEWLNSMLRLSEG